LCCRDRRTYRFTRKGLHLNPAGAVGPYNQLKSFIHHRAFRPWHPPNNKGGTQCIPYVHYDLARMCGASQLLRNRPAPSWPTIQMDSSQYPLGYCFARAVPWRLPPMLASAASSSAGSDVLSSTCRRTEIWREVRVAAGSALECDVLNMRQHREKPRRNT